MRVRGFTVIELLVVLAAIALLLSVAAPRYADYVDRAREVALQENLQRMRESIDKFYSDQGRYPADLAELVVKRYLRAIPLDPFTLKADSWRTVPAAPGPATGVIDVRSGAPGETRSGTPYASL